MTRKFQGSIGTTKVGSECEFEFEIEESDLEGKSPEEIEEYIESEAREAAFNHIDWGWQEVVDPTEEENDDTTPRA